MKYIIAGLLFAAFLLGLIIGAALFRDWDEKY